VQNKSIKNEVIEKENKVKIKNDCRLELQDKKKNLAAVTELSKLSINSFYLKTKSAVQTIFQYSRWSVGSQHRTWSIIGR
jgi:hypothetical protein